MWFATPSQTHRVNSNYTTLIRFTLTLDVRPMPSIFTAECSSLEWPPEPASDQYRTEGEGGSRAPHPHHPLPCSRPSRSTRPRRPFDSSPADNLQTTSSASASSAKIHSCHGCPRTRPRVMYHRSGGARGRGFFSCQKWR